MSSSSIDICNFTVIIVLVILVTIFNWVDSVMVFNIDTPVMAMVMISIKITAASIVSN